MGGGLGSPSHRQCQDGRETGESPKQIRPFVLILVAIPLGTGKNNPGPHRPLSLPALAIVSPVFRVSPDTRLRKRLRSLQASNREPGGEMARVER